MHSLGCWSEKPQIPCMWDQRLKPRDCDWLRNLYVFYQQAQTKSTLKRNPKLSVLAQTDNQLIDPSRFLVIAGPCIWDIRWIHSLFRYNRHCSCYCTIGLLLHLQSHNIHFWSTFQSYKLYRCNIRAATFYMIPENTDSLVRMRHYHYIVNNHSLALVHSFDINME